MPPGPVRKYSPEEREKWLAALQALTPEANPSAVRLVDQLRLIAHTLYQIGELSVTNTGLSYAKYRLLVGLFFHEQLEGRCEMNPSQISEQQGTSRNTISALIRDLEDEGLLERSLDSQDRRKFNIQLTSDGRQLVQDHVSKHFQSVTTCFDVLDEDEQETLSRLLTKLSSRVFEAHEQLADQ